MICGSWQKDGCGIFIYNGDRPRNLYVEMRRKLFVTMYDEENKNQVSEDPRRPFID